MNPNKWEKLIFLAEERFGIDKKYTEDFEFDVTSTGKSIQATKEVVEFTSPLGKMKIEKITRPIIIDRKVHHSKRIGSDTTIDYIYSDDEFKDELKICKKENDEWKELEAKDFNL